MSHRAPPELPSRRRLLTAAVWTAPVIAAAATVPTAVASAAFTGMVSFGTVTPESYVRSFDPHASASAAHWAADRCPALPPCSCR